MLNIGSDPGLTLSFFDIALQCISDMFSRRFALGKNSFKKNNIFWGPAFMCTVERSANVILVD